MEGITGVLYFFSFPSLRVHEGTPEGSCLVDEDWLCGR